jgi:hypothetical protein
MTEKKVKTCFIISPIGEEGSDTRRNADERKTHLLGGVPSFDSSEK